MTRRDQVRTRARSRSIVRIPTRGRGACGCRSSSAPASVVSEPFAPNAQSSLMIQTFFRAAAADTKVRLWIEGESADSRISGGTELSVSTGWEPRVVRASDVPAGGLDLARIRFELLEPGHTLDRRHPYPEQRYGFQVRAASRPAYLAGGLAGLPRASVRRFRTAGRLALDPTVELAGHRPTRTHDGSAPPKVGHGQLPARPKRRLLPYRRNASCGKIESRFPRGVLLSRRKLLDRVS